MKRESRKQYFGMHQQHERKLILRYTFLLKIDLQREFKKCKEK